MKKYIAILLLLFLTIVLVTCKKTPEMSTGGNKIEMVETTIDTLSYYTAKVSTTITATGGNEISQHGHCWDTEKDPSTENNKTTLGKITEPKTYTSELTDLNKNTTYYVRSYVTYTKGIVYGNEQTIKTLKKGKPIVITTEVSNITLYTAVCGGIVQADSGLAVITRGICWDIDSIFSISSCIDTTIVGNGLGSFTSNITNLNEGVEYYVKAFATNEKGTSYGEVKQFTTTPINLPIVSTNNISDITTNSAQSGGNVTDEGNGIVSVKGIVWSTNENPTIENNEGVTENGTGLGVFNSSLNDLQYDTQYYIKAYATNEKGTGYGEQKSFETIALEIPTVNTTTPTNITTNSAESGGNVTDEGNGIVSVKGIVWSTNQNPSIESNMGITENGSGLGVFNSNLTDLQDGTLYYVRSYATNEKGTGYGEQKSFETIAIGAPTVITTEISNITTTSANSGGNVTSYGGANVTARGVCWSTSSNPTTSDSHTTDGSGTGTFISSITGLTQATQYYVRAYATNSVGTSYGNEVSFETLDMTPCDGQTSVTYEGQLYNIVEIGNQCWMAENLNVGTRINGDQEQTDNGQIEKYCYDDNETNCDIYGGLYQWYEMMQYSTTQGVQGICPSGWHLPSDEEWKILEGNTDTQYGVGDPEWDDTGFRGYDAGKRLKTATGWESNTGTNAVGFSALAGGSHNIIGFHDKLRLGIWWTATEGPTSPFYRILIHDHDEVFNTYYNDGEGHSVRCLRD